MSLFLNTLSVQYDYEVLTMQEKIKVNLSYNVYHLLQKDMDDFNFHVKDGTPNKNLFYNTIIILRQRHLPPPRATREMRYPLV